MAELGEINQKEECVIEWQIKDFFSLSTEDGVYYSSPLFVFANLSWFLKLHPNGNNWSKSKGYISLFLHRKSPGSPIIIECSFGVKTVDGKVDLNRSMEYIFREKQSYGFHTFINRAKFYENKYRISPHHALTLVCRFKTKCVEFENKEISIVRKNKALEDFKELFLKRNDSDVIFKVGGQEFTAHRIILSARSPVFESTFQNDMKEKRTGVVDIEDCDPSTFSGFLSFLYYGDAEVITVENVFNLYTIADKYDVSDLRERCIVFLKENLSVDTFCDAITLALQHSENELIKLTTNFFITNGHKIVKTSKWQSFLACYPTQSNELLIKAFESFKDVKK